VEEEVAGRWSIRRWSLVVGRSSLAKAKPWNAEDAEGRPEDAKKYRSLAALGMTILRRYSSRIGSQRLETKN
jgi:hypothetical protein